MKVANLGGAVEHWLGFQEKLGRTFMMNEDALKYPIADYLVNAGGKHIGSVALEYPHPDFSQRHIDLVTKDQNGIQSAFEVKLAKSATRQQSEKQRIFNDIMRLHLVSMKSSDKCYFVMTGITLHFVRDFRKYIPRSQYTPFYAKWFSFKQQEVRKFFVNNETDIIYKEVYDAFAQAYGFSKLPKQLTTTCEYITPYSEKYIPYMTGIWSIS